MESKQLADFIKLVKATRSLQKEFFRSANNNNPIARAKILEKSKASEAELDKSLSGFIIQGNSVKILKQKKLFDE